jgi:fido (protein-threonine AMPylation protein)
MLQSQLKTRLDRKNAALHELHPLPAAAAHDLYEQLIVEWIYHSNAIEGNTLSLDQTQRILDLGQAIGRKSLVEHLEVLNHRAAIAEVESLVDSDEPVHTFHVRQLHKQLLNRIDEEEAGQYRDRSLDIAGATSAPPEPGKVPRLMGEWGNWLNGPALDLHPVERAATAQGRLLAIHPFARASGCIARLVMNLLLMREGYPPAVIQFADRHRYRHRANQFGAGKERPLVNLVGQAVERSLILYLEACTPSPGPAPGPSPLAPPRADRWVPLRRAARGTVYTAAYLGRQARRGRLEAIKRGPNWYTTFSAVAALED